MSRSRALLEEILKEEYRERYASAARVMRFTEAEIRQTLKVNSKLTVTQLRLLAEGTELVAERGTTAFLVG